MLQLSRGLEPDPREEDVQQDKGDEQEDAGHPDQVFLRHDTLLRQPKHLEIWLINKMVSHLGLRTHKRTWSGTREINSRMPAMHIHNR